MSTIGDNICKFRKQLCITQEELAKKLGYKSKSTINKIELGINDIPQRKIEQFAAALHTTPADLMGWTEGLTEDDADTIRSLGCIKPKEKLPEDIAALNVFLDRIGEQIIRVDGNCFLGECGMLTEDEIEYLKESAITSLKIQIEMLKKKRIREIFKK